jgi:hypothetical protein
MVGLKDSGLVFMENINATCPSCQQPIPEGAQFCPTCGYSFSEKQNDSETGKCPNCGQPYILPEPVFCGSCGYQFAQTESTPLVTPQIHPDIKNDSEDISDETVTGKHEGFHPEKNAYLKAAAVVGILVLISITLVGAIVLFRKNGTTTQHIDPTPNIEAIYTAAWETVVAEKNTAPVSAAIATSTANLLPTVTPSLIPTATMVVDPQKEVEDFIYYYWSLIDRKDFETAWLYQSPKFKSEVNQDNFDNFANGFQYTENVSVLRANAITVSGSNATVDAELQFTAANGKQGSSVFHEYILIKQNGQWLIDNAIAISTIDTACSSARGGRLHAGDKARILAFQLSVRDAPGGEQYGQRLNVLAQGQEVIIVEEPVCMTGMYFVKVQSKIIDEVGWVAEGDTKEYYLEPVR